MVRGSKTLTEDEARKQKGAKEALRRAADQLKTSEQVYENNLIACRKAGVPNTQIAKVLGVSEVAVRAYLKRRGVDAR